MYPAFKNFSKNFFVVGQKILISEKSCITAWANCLERVQGIIGEYRKLHNRSIMSNKKHGSEDSKCTKFN